MMNMPSKHEGDYFLTPKAVSAAFDAARLTQARRLAGLTRASVAESIGVSPAAFGQYEAGIIRPRPDLIPRIAETLGVPVAFLASGRPHAHLEATDVHFTTDRTSITTRHKAVASVEQIWELVHALERYVQLPFVDLPGFSGGELQPWQMPPADAAREIRGAWHITGPMPHLTRQLECRGVIIAAPSASEDIAGLGPHSASKLPRPVIVPTQAMVDDVYLWRWELAQQLGHLLLHGDTPPGSPGREHAAELFAAELLLPAGHVADHIAGRLPTRTVLELCRMWGVPASALMARRYQLGLVGPQTASASKTRLAAMAGEPGFTPPPVADFPGETPTIIASAFDMGIGVTVSRLAKDLAWSADRVSELLGYQHRRPTLRLVVNEPEPALAAVTA